MRASARQKMLMRAALLLRCHDAADADDAAAAAFIDDASSATLHCHFAAFRRMPPWRCRFITPFISLRCRFFLFFFLLRLLMMPMPPLFFAMILRFRCRLFAYFRLDICLR